MDVLADERDERVLQAAPEREGGAEEVGRPEAARGQEDSLAYDASVSQSKINSILQALMFYHSTDYVLVTDKTFKKWTKAYADDQDLFFKE